MSRACLATHAAFYLWYGTPQMDGAWKHWDHAVMPQWQPEVSKRFPLIGTSHQPPDEPHSPFYPSRGLYSSKDKKVLVDQLTELADAGVDSIMLSWWGQADSDVTRDSQGVSTDEIVPTVLDAAAEAGIGVSWHLEPYGGRSPRSVLADLRYLNERYGQHPAIFRQESNGNTRRTSKDMPTSSYDWRRPKLPVVWLYDVSAEHSSSPSVREEWRDVVAELRGSDADAVLLSLYVDRRDVDFVKEVGFDGAYTYFAAEGFTEGSRSDWWGDARSKMEANGKLFYPSVGPGYNDTLIRPWNAAQTRARGRGAYYDKVCILLRTT